GITGDRILIQLPGVEDIKRAKSLIGKTALLELHMVKDSGTTREDIKGRYGNEVPDGFKIFPSTGASRTEKFYLLTETPQITGADLENAFTGQDQYNMPSVNFTLNRRGAAKFAKLTGENIGKQLAIVLDGVVQSSPVIQGRISKSGEITGRFTTQEAHDLALVLRSGALPASVKYLEERSVGAALGHDSIQKGITSAILGGILVILFMLIYYRFSGFVADIALMLNIVIIMGALAGFGATLTLPGIAGIILTIGMAVDANVLIFERIREEMKLGKTLRTSIANGFSKAALTIFDANITTVIAAFVLLNFGAGPVRGFAVTLSIGIFASLFTSLFVSRLIFDLVLSKVKMKTLSMTSILKDVNIDFLGLRNFAFLASGILIAIGVVSLFTKGINYGIDFAGGTLVQVKFSKP
ncbi:MAG: protein-export membrane protein SecD, partial [Candidatus Schekmanbacteria bacterium RBG_13_48_7]